MYVEFDSAGPANDDGAVLADALTGKRRSPWISPGQRAAVFFGFMPALFLDQSGVSRHVLAQLAVQVVAFGLHAVAKRSCAVVDFCAYS